jgi:DnaD/phage-associated family protein
MTPIPVPFFVDLLPGIDHLGEMKVTLYALWFLDQLEGNFRFIQRVDFYADKRFMDGLSQIEAKAETLLDESLEKAVQRGTLIRVTLTYTDHEETYYFLNSPRGRASAQALSKGEWQPPSITRQPVSLSLERPNIFRLYEEHIGPLTPMIADALREADKSYPAEWIEDAIRIAVENNVRRWRYVEAILRSWQEEGRDDQNRGDSQKDRRRYIEGKWSDFFQH